MAAAVTEPLYTRDILRLAASVAPFEPLDGGEAELRSPTCGSKIRVVVALDDQGRVAALSQKVEACAFGQASAALMATGARGTDLSEARAALGRVERWLAGSDDAEPWPGFSALEPARFRTGRHGAMLLPFRALVAAIEAAA